MLDLQEKVFCGSEYLPIREAEVQVPEMRQHESRTTLGGFLRYRLEEELGSQELGAMLGLEDRS